MDAGSTAQVFSAGFTAVTATAALLAIWQARQQTQTAREALETQTQPLLSDVPPRRFHEPRALDIQSGQPTSWRDAGAIDIGNAGREPLCFASVPIRNVGTGTARIDMVTFSTQDGDISGSVSSPVIPPTEIGTLSMDRLPDDAGGVIAESIALEFSDFSVLVDYSDASGRHRGSLRLDIANGQYPYVRDRVWARDRAGLPKHRAEMVSDSLRAEPTSVSHSGVEEAT
jgi:hypothetical protein